jgi:hypothetical protein
MTANIRGEVEAAVRAAVESALDLDRELARIYARLAGLELRAHLRSLDDDRLLRAARHRYALSGRSDLTAADWAQFCRAHLHTERRWNRKVIVCA